MYLIHNEGKSIVGERLIKTLKNKIYKYMTAISKNVYTDQLDDIVNECNNTYHRTIKMKPVILNIKIFLLKDTCQIGLKKFLLSVQLKNTVPWTYVINDLNGEEVIGTFYEEELQKTNQKEFRIEKVLKKKGDELYVKWKGYVNSFNCWIDKKNLV